MVEHFYEILQLVNLDEQGMPIIKAEAFEPVDVLAFNLASRFPHYKKTIHFFLDDYRFERVWNRIKFYVPIIKRFAGAFSPDFSLYTGYPEPLLRYNVFRNRLVGAYWQSQGIQVIPTISWADEGSYAYCFSGVEKKSAVAISTIGVVRNSEARNLFFRGYDAMMKAIEPKFIYIYGSELPEDLFSPKLGGEKKCFPYAFKEYEREEK